MLKPGDLIQSSVFEGLGLFLVFVLDLPVEHEEVQTEVLCCVNGVVSPCLKAERPIHAGAPISGRCSFTKMIVSSSRYQSDGFLFHLSFFVEF